MDFHKPIFIVGSGRSGSSFFARLVSLHPEVAFLTSVSDGHPDHPGYSRLVLQGMSLPAIGALVRHRFEIHEAYRFWESCARGFSRPERDLLASDLTVSNKTALRSAVRAMLPKLAYAHRAANLGAVETLVGIPSTTSHVECSLEEMKRLGIPEGLVRYSVGIEHSDDLIADLTRALRENG